MGWRPGCRDTLPREEGVVELEFPAPQAFLPRQHPAILGQEAPLRRFVTDPPQDPSVIRYLPKPGPLPRKRRFLVGEEE